MSHPHPCSVCSETFKTRGERDSHFRNHGPVYIVLDGEVLAIERNEQGYFMCPCKTHLRPKHKTKRALRDHIHSLSDVSLAVFAVRVSPNMTLDFKHSFGDQGGAK